MTSFKGATFPETIDTHMILDLFERVLIVSLFIRMNIILLPLWAQSNDFIVLTILFSEGLAAFFITIHRRTSNSSLSVWDCFITIVATTGPLLVSPSTAPALISFPVSAALVSAGLVLQISAKLTLRRSFGLSPANRGVKFGGPYGLLRHPMYAGYIITQIAFLGSHPSGWNLAVYAASFLAQCARILAEERLLSQDPAYSSYMGKTPYRILPFVF